MFKILAILKSLKRKKMDSVEEIKKAYLLLFKIKERARPKAAVKRKKNNITR